MPEIRLTLKNKKLMKTIMTLLGENIGAMFAKAAEIFAKKGNVSTDFDTLEKLEILIKRLNQAVFDGTEENQLDTLAEISTFLNTNKDKILATAHSISKEDIINNLASDAIDKPLAAAQGKALKILIDDAGQAINSCLNTAEEYTNTKISEINQTLTALSQTLNNKVNTTDVYLKTEIGTSDEFTAAFNTTAGETYK